jgi:sigma-B regulation protein RsbU (phosphoserine phosphatase)
MLHMPMQPGELLLGYSDGVVDARSPSGEAFGIDRLQAALLAAPADPHAVVDRLMEHLSEFTRGAEPYDDITLVAVARKVAP